MDLQTTTPKICLNCDAPLNGNFCAVCGQKSSTARYSLRSFAHDIHQSLFHLDSRFLRTLKAMTIRPGVFIRNYLMGRRANYVSPMKYFFIVLALNMGATFVLGRPTINPAIIQSSEGIVQNQFITLIISSIFIMFIIPFAWGLRISRKSPLFTFIEYYAFLLYTHSQSILIFIIIQLILRIPGRVLEGPIEGLVWFVEFSILFIWGFLSFSGVTKKRALKSIGVSYAVGLGVITLLLSVAGLIVRRFYL